MEPNLGFSEQDQELDCDSEAINVHQPRVAAAKDGPGCPMRGPGRGSVPDVEKELAAEREEMEKWVEKCGGQGLMELLECLKREAIMGDDEGKEPGDYNRRASIFDKSSRVFGPLQQTEAAPSPGTSS